MKSLQTTVKDINHNNNAMCLNLETSLKNIESKNNDKHSDSNIELENKNEGIVHNDFNDDDNNNNHDNDDNDDNDSIKSGEIDEILRHINEDENDEEIHNEIHEQNVDEQNSSENFEDSNNTNDDVDHNDDDIKIVPKNNTNLLSLTNDELKKMLKNAKQSCKGNKQELIDRIMSLS